MKFFRKYKEEFQVFGSLAFVVGILLFFVIGAIITGPDKAERRRNYLDFQRKHPIAGKMVTTKDGLRGTVTRECWMGYNRYEVRLSDGTITYVNGKDFK
jgi:hypothetical protein